MHLIKFEADMRTYPDTMYRVEILETIQDSIKKNPQYRYLETTLYDYLSHRATIDGDFEERLQCIDRAISTARKFDDRVRLGDLLCKKAMYLLDENRAQSQDLLMQAADLTNSLGIEAAVKIPGINRISAGNYGGKLGKFHYSLHDVLK